MVVYHGPGTRVLSKLIGIKSHEEKKFILVYSGDLRCYPLGSNRTGKPNTWTIPIPLLWLLAWCPEMLSPLQVTNPINDHQGREAHSSAKLLFSDFQQSISKFPLINVLIFVPFSQDTRFALLPVTFCAVEHKSHELIRNKTAIKSAQSSTYIRAPINCMKESLEGVDWGLAFMSASDL